MKKLIILTPFAVLALCFVLATIDKVQSRVWSGSGVAIFVVVGLLLIVLALISFARMNPVKDESELDDDDGGIDWREENTGGEMVQIWNGWAVLIDDVPVHEAKALADKLEAAHMRCRLELLKEDRAFHLYGNGGMGTRMCVLVAPSDYAAAKKALMEHYGRLEP